MAKVVKDWGSPERNKKHAAALERRRLKRLEEKAVKAVGEVSEGQADFAALVEAEKQRLGVQDSIQKKAGKASPSRITAARENLTLAFDLMGGVPALVVWGRSNPTEFYRLWVRLIPKESVEVSAQLPLEALLAKLSGREGESIQEAAYQIGTEVLAEARDRVLDAEYTETPGPDDRLN